MPFFEVVPGSAKSSGPIFDVTASATPALMQVKSLIGDGG